MPICPNCGQENPDIARFCLVCATPLALTASREERKIITVLFVDLVGFTSRAELMDPEDVRALQDPYWLHVRSEIERHGGTVEKFIGDAVVALFGAPVTHEDDPERAVRAALAIRDWALEQEEIRVRIAVTTGEALVRLDSKPLAGEGMAAGDVVNTAARLQAAAPENAVLVDETTYRATKEVVVHREAKPIGAKGKAEPVAVWEAMRALGPIRPARDPRALFVGRDHESAVLRSTFASALSDSSIRLVILVGVPGIGKSRLVREFFESVKRDGTVVTSLQGRSLPYGAGGVTLWALGEIVKIHASIRESDGDAEAEEKLRLAVTDTLGDGAEADWVHAHLRPLVVPSSDPVLGGDRRAEAFAAWRRFFEALAAKRPLVLVFEDVHWADDTLLDFVEYLVEWAAAVPLLVLATARPELLERRPAWAGSKPNAPTLMLAPLTDEETARLLAALLERPLVAAEKAALLAQAAGNPLYAEEYARLLGAPEGDAEPGMAPETVQGIIGARIDALSVVEKDLLHDAAVVGKVFWSGAVGILSGRDRWSVEKRLLALERRELLRRERGSAVAGETQYSFLHDLIRDVAYGEIPHGERSDKHLRAAEWIESIGRPEDQVELLAHHYLSALEFVDRDGEAKAAVATRARIALREAGDRAFTLNAFLQAAGFYRDALTLWPSEEAGRPQLLFRYASALHVTGDRDEQKALEDARRALSEAGDPETAAEADTLLAEMWWIRGLDDQVDQHLQHAATLLGDRGGSPAKARVLAAAARFRMLAGEMVQAIDVGREALTLAEELGLHELLADALITVGTARCGMGDRGGEADLERGIALALEANALRVAQRGYNNLADAVGSEGHLAKRIKLLTQAFGLAEQLGATQQARFYKTLIAGELVQQGNWDEGLKIADEFIAECDAGSGHRHEAFVRTIRAWINFGRAQEERALADWERALALIRRPGGTPAETVSHLAAGARFFAELGRLTEAQALADEVLSCEAEAVARDGNEIAWIAARIGRSPELKAKLAAAPHEGGYWRQVADLVLAGDAAIAADGLAERGYRWAEADTRLLAAQQLLEQDLQEDAKEQLERTLSFYRSVDATRYIREAEELLHRTAAMSRAGE